MQACRTNAVASNRPDLRKRLARRPGVKAESHQWVNSDTLEISPDLRGVTASASSGPQFKATLADTRHSLAEKREAQFPHDQEDELRATRFCPLAGFSPKLQPSD